MASALRRELWVLSRSRGLVAASLLLCLLMAALYNYGARPLYRAKSVISLAEAGVSTLKARSTVDKGRLRDALRDQVRILESKELALIAVTGAEPIVAAELVLGPLGSLPDRLKEEARFKLGIPNQYESGAPALVAALRSRLVVEYDPSETWVSVLLTGYDPTATAMAVNRLVDTYIAEIEKQTTGAVGASRQRIEERVAESKKGVVETLGRLQTLEDQSGLQNLEARRAFLQKEVSRLQDALITARQSRISRQAMLDESRRGSAGDPRDLPAVREDREVAEGMNRVADLESQIARSAANLGDRHPEIVALRAELDQARKRINSRASIIRDVAARDYRIASREERSLGARIESAQGELAQLDRSSIERTFIQKQVEAGQRAAGDLIARSVREADEEPFFIPKILQRAEPPRTPASPQGSRNFQYALIIGLVTGVALAWLRAHLDETVKTPDDVKANFSVPLVGMVPRVAATDLDLFRRQEGPSNPLVEAYRVLRTNLTLGEEASSTNRLILLTSSREAEGKTTTCCGLAVALARAGARVLLVDGDVRRASLSRLLFAADHAGLTEAVEGRAFGDCIVSTVVKGLSLMPSGARRDDAAEVLNRDSLKGVVELLRSEYDWILFDAPPVLAVADAAILCRVADSVLVVIGANLTPLGSIQATLEQLAAVGARVRGLILNRVDLSRDSHYYRYYYSARYYSDYSGGSQRKPAQEGEKGRRIPSADGKGSQESRSAKRLA